jgi:hypothetical protein
MQWEWGYYTTPFPAGAGENLDYKNLHKSMISRSRSEANCFLLGFLHINSAGAAAEIHGKDKVNCRFWKKSLMAAPVS